MNVQIDQVEEIMNRISTKLTEKMQIETIYYILSILTIAT